jgi:nicotinamidase-related amidase
MQTDQITEALSNQMPLSMGSVNLSQDCQRVGMIIVDEVNGFATVGAGNLAPPAPNAQINQMVSETLRLARGFTGQNWPMLAFLDSHEPGKEEPPYPPHCESGTGEDELIPELKWLEDDPNTTLVRKDCINGFIGAYGKDGQNAVINWVLDNQLTDILVVGICTDICVMDFVLTALSARNHEMMAGLVNIHVYDKGCSTYDLQKNVALDVGLSEFAAHPQDITHYMGLYFMASRGANLVSSVEI